MGVQMMSMTVMVKVDVTRDLIVMTSMDHRIMVISHFSEVQLQ